MNIDAEGSPISDSVAESPEETDLSPFENAKRIAKDFESAKKRVEKWHSQAKAAITAFKCDMSDGAAGSVDRQKILPFFTANVQNLSSMLYGKIPQIDVTRRFADWNDKQARIGAEGLQRLLNCDIEEGHDSYASTLMHSILDRLIAGMAAAKVHYVAEIESQEQEQQVQAEDGSIVTQKQTVEQIVDENCEVEYIHWSDQLWGPGRVFDEIPWWAFREKMSREQLNKRFGENIGRGVPLNSKNDAERKELYSSDPEGRADVWEVWDKERQKVYWYVEGYARTLDEKDDPLELEHFWPFPRPIMANLTNESLIPIPDYTIAEPIYKDIDRISKRIQNLSIAIKACGVYDKTASSVSRLMSENSENTLLPIENWGAFQAQGGFRGVMDLFPLDELTKALETQKALLESRKQELFEVTGMSDIMRGASDPRETMGAQAIKAQFASVRVQSIQDEVARFATDIQKIKAEIISKHFQPATIVQRSNIQYTPDAPFAMQMVQFIKDHFSIYRIEVKPENISLTNYSQLKNERTEFVQAFAMLLQQVSAAAQAMPGSLSYMLEIVGWFVAGFRGADSIAGVIDQAIAQVQQQQQMAQANPQPPRPDPKVQAMQLKAQVDSAKGKQDLQADLIRIHAETQAEAQRKANEVRMNVAESAAQERNKAMASIGQILGGPR